MRILIFTILGVSILFILSCAKTESNNDNNPPDNRITAVPLISNIVPNQGMALTTDTIYGQNFSTTPNDNKVLFNGLQASVLTASATQLIVTVPQNGTTGPVSVTVGGQTATGPVFTYTTAPNDSVMVTTFAGSGVFGQTNGPSNTASFGFIWDLTFDKSGNLWVADGGSNKVRKVANGAVNSLVGLNTVPGMSQSQSSIQGLALDLNNLVYITDANSNPIRTINSAGTVTNFIGNIYSGTADGAGMNAHFYKARAMVFDKTGNLFIVDRGNNKIRKATPAGVVTTFAGPVNGGVGWSDGTGTAAYFSSLESIAIDINDNLYVVDNNKIRKITPAGVVTTIAGNTLGNYQDGYGLAAGIGGAHGIAVDNRNGNIYVSQNSGGWIRKIRPDGYVSTIAGTGAEGSVDGPGRTASFKGPTALAVDSVGNLYVADGSNYKIRKITFK